MLGRKNISAKQLGLADTANIFVNEWLSFKEQQLFYLTREKKLMLATSMSEHSIAKLVRGQICLIQSKSLTIMFRQLGQILVLLIMIPALV